MVLVVHPLGLHLYTQVSCSFDSFFKCTLSNRIHLNFYLIPNKSKWIDSFLIFHPNLFVSKAYLCNHISASIMAEQIKKAIEFYQRTRQHYGIYCKQWKYVYTIYSSFTHELTRLYPCLLYSSFFLLYQCIFLDLFFLMIRFEYWNGSIKITNGDSDRVTISISYRCSTDASYSFIILIYFSFSVCHQSG